MAQMTYEFKYVTMSELRARAGDLVDKVAKHNEAYIVDRKGTPLACIVPVSVFLPDIPSVRLRKEYDELSSSGEEPRFAIDDLNQICLIFRHALGREEVSIRITLPHGYPSTVPQIHVDPLPDNTPHRWADGTLCVYGEMSSWNPGKHGVLSSLHLARRWLNRYEEWRRTDRWPSEKALT